jgi:ABC-type phosphate/phosphonate transport system substrate-binding protein
MSTAAETEVRDETAELVEAWRAEQLEMAGYGAQAAAELAMRHDVDLHGAVNLVSRGCPADLALKILL